MNAKRLQKLADHLRTVPPARFAMDQWVCGTAACAVGHACMIPDFRDAGLRLQLSPFGGKEAIPHFRDADNWDAVEVFFDLSHQDATDLFMASAYADDVTPSEVADSIESFIADGGEA